VAHSQSGFNALRHQLLAYRTPQRPALYAEMVGNLLTARNVLDAVREGRIDVGPLDAYWHLLIAHHAPHLTAGIRVLTSTPVTPMPAFVAAAAAPADMVARLRAAFTRAAQRPWFGPLADLLLLEGFAEAIAIEAVAGGVLVPRDRRRFVVQRVQIVEQIKRTEDPGALDDGDARTHLRPCAVLGERANQCQAGCGDRHGQDVDPERHAADDLHPDDDRDAPQQVLEPHRPHPVCVADQCARFGIEKAADGPEGAERDPPGESLLNVHDHARDAVEASPVLRCPVVGLRVVERIGDSLIDVVRPVVLPVTLEWQPQ